MNEDAQIHSVALFFFYGLLDENLARQATLSTIGQVYNRIKKFNLTDDRAMSSVVYCTNQRWKRYIHLKEKGHTNISYEAGWLLPEGIELGLWQEFHKEADADEFLAVLWSKVLKFTDKQISEGLGVTEGTVRHRLGRGLRFLGSLRRNR